MQKIINNLLFLLILFNVFFVIAGAIFYPLASIDAVSIWFLKAKAFYLYKQLPLSILKDNLYINTHPQYPLLFPFMIFIFYTLLGGINETLISFINPLFYVLTIFVIYKLFRALKFEKTFSLLLTYIYSMLSPFLAQGGRKHAGDADILILFINWLAIFLSLKFIQKKSYRMLSLLIILVMISSQIKGEGVFLASILLFLPLARKIKVFCVIVSLIPFLLWRITINYFGIPNDFYFIIPSLTNILPRTLNIFYYTFLEMIKINNWYIFWPTFLILILFYRAKDVFVNKFVLRSLTLISALFFFFYFFLSVDPKIYVPASIDRILLQLSPFYFVIFAKLVKEMFSKYKA